MTVRAIESLEVDKQRASLEPLSDTVSAGTRNVSSPALAFRGVLASTAPGKGASAASKIHAVQAGETLWGIVEARLKESGTDMSPTAVAAAVRQVASANGMKNPNFILAGQNLDLSSLETGSQPAVDTKTVFSPITVSLPVQASLAKFDVDNVASLRPTVTVEAVGGPSKAESEARLEVTRPRVDLASLLQKILNPVSVESPVEETSSPWSRLLGKSAHLTSEYGMRRDPFTTEPQFHDGIDLATASGTRIHSYGAGVVVKSGWEPGYGKMVKVRHANGLETVYGHTLVNMVREGDEVDETTTLALVGSSGRSTGPHLHFEVRRNGQCTNPVPLLTEPHSK